MLKQISSSLISAFVLALSLTVLWLGHYFSNVDGEQLSVRQLDVAVIPPPPPPP